MNQKVRECILRALSIVGRNTRGKIVFYHDVHLGAAETDMSTPWSRFVEHVEVARQNDFTFVNHVPTGDRTLQVCFDDGFAGIWNCREELVKLGILPTVYIAVDLIGRPHYLTREQILELQGMGFTFQSHTWSHRGLTEVSADEWNHELADSRKWLTDILQREVTQLCFPKGLFSRLICEYALRAGYSDLVSSIPGSVDQGVLPQVLPRNLVQFYGPGEFGAVIKGALGLLRGRYVRRHTKGAL